MGPLQRSSLPGHDVTHQRFVRVGSSTFVPALPDDQNTTAKDDHSQQKYQPYQLDFAEKTAALP